MATPDSTAFERSTNHSHGITANDVTGHDWINRFHVEGLSLVLGAGRAADDIVVGCSSEDLVQLAQANFLDIKSNLGADRRELARALHRESGKKGSVFIDLDVDRNDSFTAVARLVTILTELADSQDEASNRSRILGSTVFVDNAQFLCDTSRACLQRLINKRLDGENIPRLLVGSITGSESGLTGLKTFEIPALSKRPNDIAKIISRRFEARRNSPSLSDNGLKALQDWSWCGEEIELSSFADRAQIKFPGAVLSAEQVHELLNEPAQANSANEPLAKIEEDHIYRVLQHHGWNRTRSAKALGIDVKTLYNKLRRYESKKRLMPIMNSNAVSL